MRQPTPRSLARARGFGTLIGNGWLRESPRDGGAKWDILRGGKSAMRKCVFMPVPEQLRGLFPQVSASALPPMPVYRPTPAEDVVAHRRDVRKDVREFAAFVPASAVDPRAVAQQAHAQHVQNAQRAAMAAAAGKGSTRGAWWEDPVALGSLLILVPPVGLAAVWSSKRYSSDARWALTVMTGLTMCLLTAIVIAVLATT
jgi:hypothetical protein